MSKEYKTFGGFTFFKKFDFSGFYIPKVPRHLSESVLTLSLWTQGQDQDGSARHCDWVKEVKEDFLVHPNNFGSYRLKPSVIFR